MKHPPRVLDLFSGIGGFSLGLERAGMQTAAFCEIDPFCRAVLRKHWPEVPIYEDVHDLLGLEWRGRADVVSAGYPCQPFSQAGLRAGAKDDRHLWPEACRIVATCRPAWFIGENVAGHISLGLDEVLSDLENLGYAAQAFIVPAAAVDAPHRRDRVWIIANVSDANGEPPIGLAEPWSECRFWPAEPGVGRVADGIPRRVDRLRALGNAVVPQIPELIGRAILAAEAERARGGVK